MKKYIISFTAIVSMLFMLSCKKILQPKVYGQFTSENFPQSQSDINAAIISFYSLFRTDWGGLYNADQGAYPPMNTLTTDQGAWVDNTALTDFTIGPGSSRYLWMYANISYVAKMTQLIDQIQKIGSIPAELKQKDIAEVKILRAWLMYIMYDMFGPVPVKLDPATLTDTGYIPRPTDIQYSKYMETDLNDALNSPLPDRYNSDPNNWGRVSKGVAAMLLLKVYMHNKEWNKVMSVGDKIINMGYSLMPNYIDVFRQERNNEIIYAVPTSGGSRSYWIQEVLPSNSDFKSVMGISSLKAGWGAQWMPWDFYDTYQSQDTRLNTIANKYKRQDNTFVTRTTGLKGAIPLKYISTADEMNNGTYDVVVFRYADVLLSMAEAKNHISGPGDGSPGTALYYLKKVTDRAHENLPASFTQSSFNTFILAERGRELYDEGFRRSTLIRFGKFISYAQQRGIDAKSYQTLLPIPSYAIIQSHKVVKQNPGYVK